MGNKTINVERDIEVKQNVKKLIKFTDKNTKKLRDMQYKSGCTITALVNHAVSVLEI